MIPIRHRANRVTFSSSRSSISPSNCLKNSFGILLDVPVSLNRLVLDYDQLIICGPVFPHEVVGFSGGNKYFFPGIGGCEVINFSHWLGAVITSYKVIGTKYTPVRAVIDRAAGFIDRAKLCMAFVVPPAGSQMGEGEVAGLFIGSPEEAYQAAADLSSRLHVVYVDKPFKPAMMTAMRVGGSTTSKPPVRASRTL